MASPLIHESIWFEKSKYEAAERQYYERVSKVLEEALKTVELSIELRNILKFKEEANMSKVAGNQANDCNPAVAAVAAAGNNEKRTKNKRNKNKKEKDAKNEQKVANCSLVMEGKPNCPGAVGANKPKGKANETFSEELKGGVQESGIPSKTGVVYDYATDNPKTKNASSNPPMKQTLASEVAKMDGIEAMAGGNVELCNRINGLEKENATLHKLVADLKNLVISLDNRVKTLEGGKPSTKPTPAPAPVTATKKEEDEDDGVDLFGSDSEEESGEAARVREERLAAYAAKKSKKPALIAKSNIILSVSPWDDETDMKEMEKRVRSIEMDGLMWGASKLVPLAYGINKLHISCVVEDDKVSVDLLQEMIQEFEDYVQSVDIAAFNKV